MVGEISANWIKSSGKKFELVGGLTLGADPITTAVSLKAFEKGIYLPACLIRKEPKGHGTNQYIEGVQNIKRGAEVLVVEDVSTTGSSALVGVERLRDAGFHPTTVLTIVDREQGAEEKFKKNGLDFHCLFKLSELLKTL